MTTPTVRMPISRAQRAMTGAAPVPVPPPMPAVTKHHMRAGEMVADFVDRLFGGGAADFRLRAGAETFGDLQAHLDDALGLATMVSAWASVLATDEIDAGEAGGDHVVDGVAAGAADAEDHDAGLEFPEFGRFQIDRHLSGLSPAFGVWRPCLSPLHVHSDRPVADRPPSLV